MDSRPLQQVSSHKYIVHTAAESIFLWYHSNVMWVCVRAGVCNRVCAGCRAHIRLLLLLLYARELARSDATIRESSGRFGWFWPGFYASHSALLLRSTMTIKWLISNACNVCKHVRYTSSSSTTHPTRPPPNHTLSCVCRRVCVCGAWEVADMHMLASTADIKC